VRTLFNCLGPLANPAGATYQLMGVGRSELLDALAGALARLGTRHAVLVCGGEGLDEVSLAAPTHVRTVRGQTIVAHTWTPNDFGLEPSLIAALSVSGPAESARVIRTVLDGDDGPAARVVWANAAAALLAAERVATPAEGVALARDTIRAGRARAALERLAACSRGESPRPH
jgi:anthranilate phosphoribosyltransferase